jgi:hypothetical protein
MVLFALVTLSGCSSAPSNPDTGEWFTNAPEPVHLVASRPGLSHVSKDYLVISPVTSNSGGSTSTYLYVVLGSSIDRTLTGAPPPQFDDVVLLLDETLMRLHLEPWSDVATVAPFPVDVSVYATYAAKVTQNQLAKIARAERMAAYVTDENKRSPDYRYLKGAYTEWGRF